RVPGEGRGRLSAGRTEAAVSWRAKENTSTAPAERNSPASSGIPIPSEQPNHTAFLIARVRVTTATPRDVETATIRAVASINGPRLLAGSGDGAGQSGGRQRIRSPRRA